MTKKTHNLRTALQSKIDESHETVDESREVHGPAEFKGLIGDFLLVSRTAIRLIGLKEFRNDRIAKIH